MRQSLGQRDDIVGDTRAVESLLLISMLAEALHGARLIKRPFVYVGARENGVRSI